jgi:hypothetical protein
MNDPAWFEPPPPQTGMGCFGKGCLTVVVFVLVMVAAFAGGTYLAIRFLRSSYFTTTPAQLPASVSTSVEQAAARAKWDDFERAARAHTARRIELTADEINALIASEPKLRGKAYVSIEDDTAHLQISVPLVELRLFRDRYMNAECTMQSAEDGNPAHARVNSIVVNGRVVGEDVLNWSGPWGFRRYIAQWTDELEVNTFEIKDGKVIMASRGRAAE